MAGLRGASKACCSIPPIVSIDYKAKGSYEDIGGTKTYVIGPSSATKGIFVIYDIFGYFPQALQGADILAAGDNHNQYRVFIPDLLDGQLADIDWVLPNTDEKKKNLQEFLSGRANPRIAVDRVFSVMNQLRNENPKITNWGAVGLCWGGKIISLTSKLGTEWNAAAACHSAMLDPSDGVGISIPFCMLASKDEDAKDVKAFGEALEGERTIRTFGDQTHGWMAARGNLGDGRVAEEYRRGYATLLEFFGKHLSL